MINNLYLYFVVVLIIIFIVKQPSNKIESFCDIDIDKIKFGKITPAQKLLKKRKITSFTLPLPLGTMPIPISLSKLDKELRYISKLTTVEATNVQKKDAIKYNNGLLSHYIKFAGKHGLTYSDTHLKQISDDLDSFGIRMKYLYSRPRPSQYAFLKGYPIDTSAQSTQTSPSYPCMHTLKARIFSDLLTYNNPKFKDKLDALASKIELSRLFGGFNYPSDNKAAKSIARVLKSRIKYLEVK
jgi:hypothetical protein